jgi:hypothetical protein
MFANYAISSGSFSSAAASERCIAYSADLSMSKSILLVFTAAAAVHRAVTELL